jgi:hypothetical protein
MATSSCRARAGTSCDLARVVGSGRGGGGGDVYVLVERSGRARQISPEEARAIRDALGGGMIPVASRTVSSRSS